MHSRFYRNLLVKSPETCLVAGRFTTAGASNPSVKEGPGFTVVHSATGKYTVTLADKFPAYIVAKSELIVSGATDQHRARIDSYDPTTGALLIYTQTLTAGAWADADLTGPEVAFLVLAFNTKQTV